MTNLQALYQQVILDHGRNPRHFFQPEHAQIDQVCFNPLCGDKIHVYCDYAVDRKTFQALSFTGDGCAISVASASLMMVALQKKDSAYFYEAFDYLKRLLAGETVDLSTIDAFSAPEDIANMRRIQVIAGVKNFPMRVKCATCAWHTMAAVVKGGSEPIKTE